MPKVLDQAAMRASAQRREGRLRPLSRRADGLGPMVPGHVVDYRNRLGIGAQADVYRALHLDSGEERVLKLSRPGKRLYEAHRSEVAVGKRLRGPGRVEFRGEGKTGSSETEASTPIRPYSLWKREAGETLSDMLGMVEWPGILNRNTLSCSAAIAVGLGMIYGLRTAHEARVSLCDLKPPNTQVSPDGGITLLDLGGASEFGRPQALPLFSDRFAAPELRATQPVGAATDIHGIGATLFTAVTGRPPFLSLQEISHPPPLTSLRPDLPQAFGELVDRSLRPRIEERFPDLDAMAWDLLDIVPGDE